MTANRVVVSLDAKDNISGAVANMKGNVASGMKSAIAQVAALTAAVAASAMAFSSLGSGMSTAMTLQTQQITTVYGLANVMGSTVSDAKKTTKELSAAITEMGDKLPGATEDYNKFANALSTTVAFNAKGDMKKYKEDIQEASKYGGLLAATSNVDATQGAGALNKFLSGGMSTAEAFNTSDIFQKNQGFKAYLAAAQKQLGTAGKDFKTGLNSEQRIAAFNLAGKLQFTEANIAAYANTVDTQFQALKSKLFNPVTGIFGFMRELKDLDGRTALDTVGTFLGQITKLGDSASKWLASNGVNLDPMAMLAKAVDSASTWAEAFSSALQGDGSNLNTMMTQLADTLLDAPKVVAKGINTLIANMSKLLKVIDPKQAGEFLADLVTNIGEAFNSIRVEDITSALNWGIEAVAASLKGVDWGVVGAGIGGAIGKAAANFDWQGAAKMLDEARWAVFKALAGAIQKFADVTFFDPIKKHLTPPANVTPEKRKEVETQKNYIHNVNPANRTLEAFPERGMGSMDIRSTLPSINQLSANSSKSSVFAPVVNLTGTATKDQADYIIQELNNQYRAYRDSSLA